MENTVNSNRWFAYYMLAPRLYIPTMLIHVDSTQAFTLPRNCALWRRQAFDFRSAVLRNNTSCMHDTLWRTNCVTHSRMSLCMLSFRNGAAVRWAAARTKTFSARRGGKGGTGCAYNIVEIMLLVFMLHRIIKQHFWQKFRPVAATSAETPPPLKGTLRHFHATRSNYSDGQKRRRANSFSNSISFAARVGVCVCACDVYNIVLANART